MGSCRANSGAEKSAASYRQTNGRKNSHTARFGRDRSM